MARSILSQDNKIKQGRGKGRGKDYKPHLTVRDVPSLGLSKRIKGITTERVSHLLSKLETQYFLVLDWALPVVDIREQFALPLEETLEIARRLGIGHPMHPTEKTPVVMTTDFLVDVLSDGIAIPKARSIKYKIDLSNKRVIEKLEIERTYWAERNIDWGIVTEEDISEDMAFNIEWVFFSQDPKNCPDLADETILQIEGVLLERFASEPRQTLAKAALSIDHSLGLKPGTSLWVVKCLIAGRHWEVDMSVRIQTDQPLFARRANNFKPT
jgi:hypothetical protein